MLQRVEILIRLLRRYLSSSRLLVKLLGLSSYEPTGSNKGLVVIQTDALRRDQLEKALAGGKMPFLKNILEKQHYTLHTHYSRMPCTTADVQAELFYGVKSAVPTFTFYDHECGRTCVPRAGPPQRWGGRKTF
jgi:hypothetical protein